MSFKSKFALSLLAVLIGISFAAVPASALAAGECATLEDQFNQLDSGGQKDELLKKFPRYCTATKAASKAINVLLGIAGAVAVIVIMYGGFMMITSAGNEERYGQGRRALVAALLGLIVIILAATIMNIVANLVTKGVPF
jgi:hypothetical protein